MSEAKQAKVEGQPSISQHDKAVLNRLFNPNLPYGDVVDEEEADSEDTAGYFLTIYSHDHGMISRNNSNLNKWITAS